MCPPQRTADAISSRTEYLAVGEGKGVYQGPSVLRGFEKQTVAFRSRDNLGNSKSIRELEVNSD